MKDDITPANMLDDASKNSETPEVKRAISVEDTIESDIDLELERVESIEGFETGETEAPVAETNPPESMSPDVTRANDTAIESTTKRTLDDIVASANLSADKKEKPKRPTGWIVTTILLFFVLVGMLGYYFYEKTGSSSDSQTAALTTELDAARAQNATLTNEITQLKAVTTDTTPTDEYRVVPEFDVRYKLTDANKDLTYTYVVAEGAVKDTTLERLYFSTKEISAIKEPKSATVSANSPYVCSSDMAVTGILTRYTQAQFKAEKEAAGAASAAKYDAAKQVGDYYYLFTSPQQNGCLGLDIKAHTAAVDVTKATVAAFEAVSSKQAAASSAPVTTPQE